MFNINNRMETVKLNCRTRLLHYIPSCVCVRVLLQRLQSWLCSSGCASAGPTDVHFNSWLSRWLRMQSRQATVPLIGSGCLFSSCTSQVWIQEHLILCLGLHLNHPLPHFFPFLSFSGKVGEPNRCRWSFQESQRSATTRAGMMKAYGFFF